MKGFVKNILWAVSLLFLLTAASASAADGTAEGTAADEAVQYCQCGKPKPDGLGGCKRCKLKIMACEHNWDKPPMLKKLSQCKICGGWWMDTGIAYEDLDFRVFCRCNMPYPNNGTAICKTCQLLIKRCVHKSELPPTRRPLTKCSKCNGWWRSGFCECGTPDLVLKNVGLCCRRCGLRVKVCSCAGSFPPEIGGDNEKCPDCGGWRKQDGFCHCGMPSPKGRPFCTFCQKPIRHCDHWWELSPTWRPLTKCSKCDGWWRSGFCGCGAPDFVLWAAGLCCRRCELRVKICSCADSKPPEIGGKNEKCAKCSGWKKQNEEEDDKDDDNKGTKRKKPTKDRDEDDDEKDTKGDGEDIPLPPSGGGKNCRFSLHWYFLADWTYFLKYFLTDYNLHCENPSRMTSREFYINALDRMFKGEWPSTTKEGAEAVKNFHLWSYLGMRFAIFVGNPVGGDDKYEYCPFAFRYPFLSHKAVCLLPRRTEDCRKTFQYYLDHQKMVSPELGWAGDLTYFPEPNDEFSRNAEKLARMFCRAVHSDDPEIVKRLTGPGSPVSKMSIASLRKHLPLNGRPGRSSSPWGDTRLVPFMTVSGEMAISRRVLIQRCSNGHLHVCDIR